MRRVAGLLVALALLLMLLPATGQAAKASLPDIEDEVMCVTCNVPLNIAESPQANRERAFIQGLIDQGRTKAQIKDALVVEYGDDVLGTPGNDGFGITAYLIPALLIALLIAGAAFAVPRWRGRGRGGPGPELAPASASLSPADTRRLDEDLARYDA